MNMKNNFYVYEHWRLDRDECFYVGKGTGKRAYVFDGRNKYHKAICAKLSRIGSAFEVRIVASGLTEVEAFQLEIDRIKFWRETNIELANLATGGKGGLAGYVLPKEHKEKISKTLKGVKKPEGFGEKLSRALKGRKLPPELRVKLSLAHAGKKRGPQSEEVKKKLSDAKKGIKFSAEHKQKLREARLRAKVNPALGHKVSDEAKTVMAEKRREWWAKKRAETV
jgi:hypothetical protein